MRICQFNLLWSAIVKNTIKPTVKGFRPHGDSTTFDVLFVLLAFNEAIKILKVCNVSRTSYNSSFVDFVHALEVGITRKAAIVSHCVGSNDDAILVFDAKDRSSNSDWVLRTRIGCSGILWRSVSVSVGKLVISRWVRTTLPKWRGNITEWRGHRHFVVSQMLRIRYLSMNLYLQKSLNHGLAESADYGWNLHTTLKFHNTYFIILPHWSLK